MKSRWTPIILRGALSIALSAAAVRVILSSSANEDESRAVTTASENGEEE
jgi:hypothetical protein